MITTKSQPFCFVFSFHSITNAQVAINILVMTFAVLLGASSSISGIYNVVNNNGTTFAPPCYLPR